jgi:hypothetical protein
MDADVGSQEAVTDIRTDVSLWTEDNGMYGRLLIHRNQS